MEFVFGVEANWRWRRGEEREIFTSLSVVMVRESVGVFSFSSSLLLEERVDSMK